MNLLQMLDYNVPGGKLNRGMAVYDTLEAIKGSKGVTADEAFKANILGWCIELVWYRAAYKLVFLVFSFYKMLRF